MNKELDALTLKLEGHHLVEAGAGTGKTYTISSLFIRALIEKKVFPSQILVLTFTNDATNELKHRLRSRVQQLITAKEGGEVNDDFIEKIASQVDDQSLSHLKKCLFLFDEASISTIHGFCQRVLMEYNTSFEIPPGFDILSDDEELILEATDYFWNEFFFGTESTSKFLDWYKSHLNLVFQSPDKLLKHIKKLIQQPDIHISPQGVLQDCLVFYEQSVRSFLELKAAFDQDIDELKSFFFSSALNGTKYRSRDRLLDNFTFWINQENDCPTPIKDLHKFGRFMQVEGPNKNQSIPELTLFGAVDRYMEAYERLSEIETAFLIEAVHKIRARVAELKQIRGKLGYNDLLLFTRDGLLRSPEIRKILASRFPIAFIDEFQDTDHIQYSIFSSIYSNRKASCMVLIGDPKQAIYRFRGADLNTYLLAKRDIPPEHVYTLTHNYRSASKLIQAINALFAGTDSPFKVDELDFVRAIFPASKENDSLSIKNKEIAPLQIREFSLESKNVDALRLEIANSLASEIVGILKNELRINEKEVQQNQIAVLVDTHRNATLVQAVLWEYGLRSIINSKASVFESNEADELHRILIATSNPFDPGYLRSALTTSLLGYQLSDLPSLSEEDIKSTATLFSELKTTLESGGLGAFFTKLEQDFDVLINLAKTFNPERSITNYKHLIELLSKTERQNSLSLRSVIRHLRRKRDQHDSVSSEEDIVRLESDEQLIQIVTHHASKGLEYPVVFCPFLWGLSIRKPKVVALSDGKTIKANLNYSSEDYKQDLDTFRSEEESEKLRLAYVALTRAKALCFVYANSDERNNHGSFDAINYLMNSNQEVQQLISNTSFVVSKKKISILDEVFDREEINQHKEIKTLVFSRSDMNEFDRVVSFSSISNVSGDSDISFTDFDYDEDARSIEEDLNSEQELDVFTLPKGKATGNLLHSIFEKIDFADPSTINPVINELLSESGFDAKWQPTLLNMVESSLDHTLFNNVSLSKIKKEDRLVEMEFYFPVKNLDSFEFYRLLGKDRNRDKTRINGFMKGFIDLIFRIDGKYYILDYKSNYLGNSYSYYSQSKLKEEITHADYDVQYHIYLIAFLRYMKSKFPEFDYDQDFGGVIYLFLRGIEAGLDGSGVFYHKPEVEVLNRLEQLITGEGLNV